MKPSVTNMGKIQTCQQTARFYKYGPEDVFLYVQYTEALISPAQNNI